MHLHNVDVVASIDSLAEPVAHCDASVFPNDSLWYSLFEQHVLEGSSDVRVVQAIGDDTKSTLILPLVRTSNLWRGITLESMQNYYSVDYRPLCSTCDARALIAPALAAIIRDESPDIIHLEPLDTDAPETILIRNALEVLGWRVYTSTCLVNWVHDFTGTYEDYMCSRPGKIRSTLKRRGAKLMALEGMSISVHDGVFNLEKLIQSYQIVYDRSWKVTEPHDRFIPALIAMVAANYHLRVGLIKIGERPVAVHFWIVKHGHAYIYKLAHDKEFDAYSPGTVLMSEMVKYVLENDHVTRLDFMSGDDKYKQDWMSERREKLSLMAYNSRSPRGRLAHIVDMQVKPFMRPVTY